MLVKWMQLILYVNFSEDTILIMEDRFLCIYLDIVRLVLM